MGREDNVVHREQGVVLGRGFWIENVQTRGGDLRTVDTHVKRLRKKLQEGRGDQLWSLATVWGVGYKFDIAP